MPKFSNRLAHETSPYLRQHAHNPVDWYPWGPEALARARELERPIFLSIGYSACHWCHVMEHESFEDEEVGDFLNRHFVSIKVDREERPDLDQIYMTAVQILTRQGGWPMSMFLTPDGKPFYGGTYFPPDDRYGRPSFRRVLGAVQDAWANNRQGVLEQAGHLTEHVQTYLRLEPAQSRADEETLRQAGRMLGQVFDPIHGGFGQAPKFPHPMEVRLLLRLHQRFGDDQALAMAVKSLDEMARGGLYDQLGGGFHRYSTDAGWLVPHFEKMLYDNALLTVAYLEAYQVTGTPFFREVVEETLGYVLREMTGPEGAFFSTQDADSEGEEGKFFVWSAAEIESILGKEQAALFASIYDVSPGGNWEGKNILHRGRSWEQDAKMLGMTEPALRDRIETSRRKLFAERDKRVKPGLDDKILTSWNGLMIAAFAQAAQVLERPDYAAAAERASRFLLEKMRTPEGRLWRTSGAGGEAKLAGYSEDYAFVVDALLHVYETTFDLAYLRGARELADILLAQFQDEKEGGFFYTARDHEVLIARNKDPHDNAIPSGNAMAATALLRLAKFTGERTYQEAAERTLAAFGDLMRSSPQAAGQMLLALDWHLGPVREIAVVGEGNSPDAADILGLVRRPFVPRKIVVRAAPNSVEGLAREIPLLKEKTAGPETTVYVCRDFTCAAPIVGARAFAEKGPRELGVEPQS